MPPRFAIVLLETLLLSFPETGLPASAQLIERRVSSPKKAQKRITSDTEPLVTLRYFGPQVNPDA